MFKLKKNGFFWIISCFVFLTVLFVLVRTTSYLINMPGWVDDFYMVNRVFRELGFAAFLPWNYQPINWMGHPPGMPILVHLFNFFFDNVIKANRALSYLLFIILNIFIFYWSYKRKLPLFFASILLLLAALTEHIHLVLASANADMVLLFFGFLGLFLIDLKKVEWGFFAIVLAVLIRESGIAFAIAALILVEKERFKTPRQILTVILPFIVLFLHFLMSFIVHDNWSAHPYAMGKLMHFEASAFNFDRKLASWDLFTGILNMDMDLSTWAGLTAIAILGLLILQRHLFRLAASLLLVIILFVGFFIYYEDHAPRDFASAIFALFILIAFAISSAAEKSKYLQVFAGLFITLVAIYFIPVKFEAALFRDVNLWYPDLTRCELYKKVGQTISEIPIDRIRIDSSEILMGRYRFRDYNYTPRDLFEVAKDNKNHRDVAVVFSPIQAMVEHQPRLEEEVKSQDFELYKSLQVGRHWARIYISPEAKQSFNRKQIRFGEF